MWLLRGLPQGCAELELSPCGLNPIIFSQLVFVVSFLSVPSEVLQLNSFLGIYELPKSLSINSLWLIQPKFGSKKSDQYLFLIYFTGFCTLKTVLHPVFSYFLSFGSFIKTEKLKVLLVAGQVIRLCRPQSLHIYNRVIFYPT